MSQRRVEEAQVVSHMYVFDDEVVHHDEGQHLTALRSEVHLAQTARFQLYRKSATRHKLPRGQPKGNAPEFCKVFFLARLSNFPVPFLCLTKLRFRPKGG